MMAGGREGPRRGREQAQLRITTFPWCPDRLLGQHIASGATLSVEVTERRIDDRGGGLARVNGMVRLVEGLALPREEDEAKLGHYDTPTSWITIDPLLELFGLTRASLADEARVKAGVRARLLVLPRERGQQLKDVAQLDGWVRDGSLAYVEGQADFGGG
jgi:hypothetical protein